MKYCTNCGYRADDNMLYCIECGERLPNISAPGKKTVKRKKSIRFIAGVCFAFLACWYGMLAVQSFIAKSPHLNYTYLGRCQIVLSLSLAIITISLFFNKHFLTTVGGGLVVALILFMKIQIAINSDDISDTLLGYLIYSLPELIAFTLLSVCGIARHASGITGVLAGVLISIFKIIADVFDWSLSYLWIISVRNILIFAVGAVLLGIAFHERKPKKAVNSNNT